LKWNKRKKLVIKLSLGRGGLGCLQVDKLIPVSRLESSGTIGVILDLEGEVGKGGKSVGFK
jgi:hypothetical protein